MQLVYTIVDTFDKETGVYTLGIKFRKLINNVEQDYSGPIPKVDEYVYIGNNPLAYRVIRINNHLSELGNMHSIEIFLIEE
jgi:hypothetical protein